MAGLSAEGAKGTPAVVEPNKEGGGVSSEPPRSEKGKKAMAVGVEDKAGSSGSGIPVEKMMARLRLVIDDQDDADLVDPDRAFVGKVLAPNVLHIQTISAAMRPAWGNLKGLTINTAGNNLFTAEFGSMADRDRIMDGSPWRVGKHAVLLKKYDADIEPQRVVFDRLAIWARIIALPPRLMRVERGFEIARPIGVVKKIDSDDRGQCWGGFMRLRVEIAVQEPLVRVVTVFSSRLQIAV
jgi:hypothetical protein